MTILRSADHGRWLGDGLWEMFKTGELVDITVHYNGKSVDVHRLVLAVLSPVLRPSLVSLSTDGIADNDDVVKSTNNNNSTGDRVRSINLDDVIDGQVDLDVLLEFMYRGEVALSDLSNLPSLLRTAEALKIRCLVDAIDEASSRPPRTKAKATPQPPKRRYRKKAVMDNHVEQITVTVDHHLLMSTPAASTRSATTAAAAAAKSVACKAEQDDEQDDVDDKEVEEIEGQGQEGEDDDENDHDNDDSSPSFWCPHCCELFTSRPIYEEHMTSLHPTPPGEEAPISAIAAARLRRRGRGRPRLQGPATKAKSKSKDRKKAKAAAGDHLHDDKDEGDDDDDDCDSLPAGDDAEYRHACSLCDFWTAHSWRLTKHLAAIHKVFEHGVPQVNEQCPECDYRCATRALLRRHIKSKHSTDRPFKCTDCDYTAAIYSDLNRHKTIKHCVRRHYACSVCGYRSKTKNARDRHQNTHAKTPLLCKTCGLRYTSDGYRRHVKSHVVTDENGTNSATVIKCHLCEQLMPITDLTEPIMRLHLLDVHSLDVDKKNAQIERSNRARMKWPPPTPPQPQQPPPPPPPPVQPS